MKFARPRFGYLGPPLPAPPVPPDLRRLEAAEALCAAAEALLDDLAEKHGREMAAMPAARRHTEALFQWRRAKRGDAG